MALLSILTTCVDM